jgi:hypothetical protein
VNDKLEKMAYFNVLLQKKKNESQDSQSLTMIQTMDLQNMKQAG